MTNAEAISLLRGLEKSLDGYCELNEEGKKAFNKAISAMEVQEWIPCDPSELPKDKKLWVTHYNHGYRYVDELFWDMTEWSDTIEDVIAYKPYIEPEPYREDGD